MVQVSSESCFFPFLFLAQCLSKGGPGSSLELFLSPFAVFILRERVQESIQAVGKPAEPSPAGTSLGGWMMEEWIMDAWTDG